MRLAAAGGGRPTPGPERLPHDPQLRWVTGEAHVQLQGRGRLGLSGSQLEMWPPWRPLAWVGVQGPTPSSGASSCSARPATPPRMLRASAASAAARLRMAWSPAGVCGESGETTKAGLQVPSHVTGLARVVAGTHVGDPAASRRSRLTCSLTKDSDLKQRPDRRLMPRLDAALATAAALPPACRAACPSLLAPGPVASPEGPRSAPTTAEPPCSPAALVRRPTQRSAAARPAPRSWPLLA